MTTTELYPNTQPSPQNQATRFIEAIKEKNISLVRDLLDAGQDPNTTPPKALSPLSTAVRTRNALLVDLLLQHGAELTLSPADYVFEYEDLVELILSSRRSKHALLTAIHFNQPDIIAILLDHAKAKIDMTGLDPAAADIPLAAAIAQSPISTIETIAALAKAIDLEKSFTLLRIAMEWRRDPAIIDFSISKYLRLPQALPMQASHSALFQAAAYNYPDVASFFLERGIDINSTLQRKMSVAEKEKGHNPIRYVFYQTGDTPLLIAAERGHAEMVSLLLKRGASLSARRKWRLINHTERVEVNDSVIDLAMEGLHADVVRTLHRWGVKWDLNQGFDSGQGEEKDEEGNGKRKTIGERLLIAACRQGNVDMVEILLGYGVSPDVRGEDGKTPLLWAISMNKAKVARCLLKGGANPESTGPHFYDTTRQVTPLLWAAYYGKPEIVNALLEFSADVEARDPNGRTALTWAAQKENQVILESLLGAGAEVDALDRCRRTPLFYAVMSGWFDGVKILLEHGSRGTSITSSAGRDSVQIAREFHLNDIEDILSGRQPSELETDDTSTLNDAVPSNGSHTSLQSVYKDTMCRVCYSDIRPTDPCFTCHSCKKLGFDICRECVGIGETCLDNLHTLQRGRRTKDWGWELVEGGVAVYS